MDNTIIHPKCENQIHLIDLHMWRGAPQNLDETRQVQILVNQGYVAGFCPDRLQPLWSAYRVAYASDDVKYDRPINYYNDLRLKEENRIGKNTFGKIGGIKLNVGHMTPNEVINRQFGRLAQMETFFMSNMSPQYGSLNQGVWLKLENAIRNIEDEPGEKDHVWVIVGPVFSQEPESIYRGRGKYLPVPESYFCVTVDPFRYPFDTLSKAHIDCFLIPQNAPSSSSPEDYKVSLEEVEEATKLKFFDSWSRDIPLGSHSEVELESQSRLVHNIRELQSKEESDEFHLHNARKEAKSIDDLIETLQSEAARINILGRVLTSDEIIQLKNIQHTISWLLQAREIDNDTKPKKQEVYENFVTYKITSDMDGKLKEGARSACNFWNKFIEPRENIVVRLGTFRSWGSTIARAYKPYVNNNVKYGRVEFNKKFLGQYTSEEIAGTIIHEIGHTLGMGWEDWRSLFDHKTGKFNDQAIKQLNGLVNMEVELDGGSGTALSHWDETIFGKELMTGYKNLDGEHVLPITIQVMALLGHKIKEELTTKTALSKLLEDASNVIFSRQDKVSTIDLDHFEETDLMETIPHS